MNLLRTVSGSLSMTTSTPLRQRMIDALQLQGLTAKTQNTVASYTWKRIVSPFATTLRQQLAPAVTTPYPWPHTR